MMCEECGMRNANVHVAMLINGEMKERYLCTDCVAKHQLLRFDLSGMMNRLKDPAKIMNSEKLLTEEPVPEISCSQCGTTFAEYKKTGLLGCPACYSEFREQLTGENESQHGVSRHCGRTPGHPCAQVSLHMQLDKLKQQMTLAIQEEEYETAAKIRDQIREINAALQEDAHDQ